MFAFSFHFPIEKVSLHFIPTYETATATSDAKELPQQAGSKFQRLLTFVARLWLCDEKDGKRGGEEGAGRTEKNQNQIHKTKCEGKICKNVMKIIESIKIDFN